MILMYIALILLFCLIAFRKGKNTLFWSLGIYQVSSYIILISLLIYNIIIVKNYSLQNNFFEKTGYYIILHLQLRLTDVVTLYNLGNLLLLSSSVIFLIVSDKKITLWKVLLFIPPIVYFIVNHSRVKYMIWNYCMTHEKNSPFNILVIANTIILILYFLLPIIQIICQYLKTKIISKKKYLFSTAIYILIMEITMGFVLCLNSYSNYFPLRYDVNSLPINIDSNVGSWFSANSMYTEILIGVAVIVLIYILYSCDFGLTFNINSRRRQENSVIENDEMLKTIFHTYKNAFFAIERFGNILENNIDHNNSMANTALENIKNISHSSYIDLKRMLDSIILSYDFQDKHIKLNLRNVLNDLLLQFSATPKLTIEQNYTEEDVSVVASRPELTEAFVNIVNNAVEATEGMDNPIINISLFTEDNSAIINFTDNGHGIPQKNIKKIFRPLYSSKQSTTNLGIGLSTSLKIISYYGGSITCKSKPDKYTLFQIVLPLANK